MRVRSSPVRRRALHVFLLLGLAAAACRTVPGNGGPGPTPAVRLVEDAPSDLRARLEAARQRVEQQRARIEAAYAADRQRRLDAANAARAARAAAVVRAGGPRAAIEATLAALRAAVAAASAEDRARMEREGLARQEASLSGLLGRLDFCATPIVFGEEDLRVGQRQPSVVEPKADVFLYGCHLGADRGAVQLTLAEDGDVLPLTVVSWSDTVVQARLGVVTGRRDQPATLRVSVPGASAVALDVQFAATRVLTYVDPVAHENVVYVDCGDRTSTDACAAYATKGPPRALFAAMTGDHEQICCYSESETDRWTVALKNGWRLFLHEEAGLSEAPDIPDVYYYFAAEGLVKWAWSNEGKITDYVTRPSPDPRWQGETDISWWVDWSGSGIVYLGNIYIDGPVGVPYW